MPDLVIKSEQAISIHGTLTLVGSEGPDDNDHATFELNFEYEDEEGYGNTAQGYARIELVDVK